MAKPRKLKSKSQPKPKNLFEEVSPEDLARIREIVALMDDFCDRLLNDEYKAMCRQMAVNIGAEGAPIHRGKAAGWASGLVYSVGRVNFLTDPTQDPHLKAEEIAQGLGVSTATMYARSKEIWDLLRLRKFDPEFTVPSMVDQNLLIWMLSVNGFLMDIRQAPREAQVVAFEKGLIPYIPADHVEDSEE